MDSVQNFRRLSRRCSYWPEQSCRQEDLLSEDRELSKAARRLLLLVLDRKKNFNRRPHKFFGAIIDVVVGESMHQHSPSSRNTYARIIGIEQSQSGPRFPSVARCVLFMPS